MLTRKKLVLHISWRFQINSFICSWIIAICNFVKGESMQMRKWGQNMSKILLDSFFNKISSFDSFFIKLSSRFSRSQKCLEQNFWPYGVVHDVIWTLWRRHESITITIYFSKKKSMIGWQKIMLQILRPLSALSNEGSISFLPLFVASI